MTPFVDRARYPIDDLDSAGAVALAARCRAELDESGVSILPGFLTASATAAAVEESEALAPLGHPSDVEGTPYLELPADVGPRVTRGSRGTTRDSPQSRTTGSRPF